MLPRIDPTTSPQRTRVCSAEEARRLLDDLKAAFDSLSLPKRIHASNAIRTFVNLNALITASITNNHPQFETEFKARMV